MARIGLSIPLTVDSKGVDKGTAEASRRLNRFQGDVKHASVGISKHALGIAAGFTSVAGAVSVLEDSASSVEALAKGTAALSRSTGMDATASSEWVQIAKIRGVEATQLNMGFVKLAQNIEGAAAGSKKQAEAFKQLGISQEVVKRGDVSEIIGKSADAFAKMANGPQKAALAQQLFGRQAKTLLPILNGGSKALEEQLASVKRYGAALDESGVKKAKEAIEAQHHFDLAMEGVKNTLGTEVLPIVAQAAGSIAEFVAGMRDGTGAGGKFAHTLGDIWDKAKPVVQFLKDHPKLIAVAVGAWATYKVATKTALAAGTFIDLYKKAFAKSVPIAAEQGAAAGGAYATSFDATSAAGIGRAAKGGKIRGAMTALGKTLGPIAAAVLAGEIINDTFNKLTPDQWSRAAKGNLQTGIDKIITDTINKAGGHGVITAPHGPRSPQARGSGQRAKTSGVHARTSSAGPAAHTSAAGRRVPGHSRKEILALVAQVWQRVKRLSGTSATMPAVAFGGLPAGADGLYNPETHTITLEPDFLAYPAFRDEDLETLFHELTHAAQRGFLSKADAEGGATAFTRIHSSRVYGKMGVAYHTQTLKGDPYAGYERAAAKRPKFVAAGQFSHGGSNASASGAKAHASGGGSVSGDNVTGEMRRRLLALSAATGHPISIQSGLRTMGEQEALVREKGLYGPGNPTGAAAPSASAPHVAGIAADITPGREVFGSVAGRFGLGFPLPQEPWHIQFTGSAPSTLPAGAAGGTASGGGHARRTGPTHAQVVAKRQGAAAMRGAIAAHGRQVGAAKAEIPTNQDRLDQALATGDILLAGGDPAGAMIQALADQARLREINHQLKKKHLSAKKRTELLQEKAGLLGSLKDINATYGPQPAADAGTGEDPNQPLIDALAAAAAAAQAQTDALNAVNAEVKRGNDLTAQIRNTDKGVLLGALADAVSSSIGGPLLRGLGTPSFAGGSVNY